MNILVIASHPDDEILGCGGTIKKLKNEGHDIFCLLLGSGITSRDRYKREDIDKIYDGMNKAHEHIGFKETYTKEFPDNAFDSVPLLKIVKAVEEIKKEVKPEMIFTHSKHCLNIDHQRTFEAVLTATRPMEDECVREVLSFEIMSSTEWVYPQRFSPNVFYDISSTIKDKVNAMRCYENELREYPHPRSVYGLYQVAQMWGMRVGVPFAEAFECIRTIK